MDGNREIFIKLLMSLCYLRVDTLMATDNIDIKIANCLELHHQEGDVPLDTIRRFLDFAHGQDIYGEMAYHVLRNGTWSVGMPILEDSILGDIRDESEQAGVLFVADHWLGSGSPDNAYITSPVEPERETMARYFAARAEGMHIISDNEHGSTAVVGSPKKRNLDRFKPPILFSKGLEYFGDTIARAINHAPDAGVIYAPERLVCIDLPNGETDIVYNMGQAVDVARNAQNVLDTRLHGRVKVMVDLKAAYWSDPRETVERAFNLIPKDLRSYHFHVQSPNMGPPGYNDRGEFMGEGVYDMSRDIGFIVGLARQGHPVVVSVEAFQPFFGNIGVRSVEERQAYLKKGNDYLKELIAKARQN